MRLLSGTLFGPNSLKPVAVGLGCWLLIAALTGLGLWRERTHAIDAASRSAETTVALMEQHTASTFHAVAMALEDISHHAPGLAANDAELRRSMQTLVGGMPYVRALYVVGPDGFIKHDTEYPSTPPISLSDRPYFKAHESDPSLLRAISSPLQSRSGTGWFVAVTRRLGAGPDFKGVAVGAIQLRYFADLYRRIGLGEGQRILMFHTDGRLLSQFPADDARIGRTFTDYPLFQQYLPRSDQGVHLASGPPLPYERIFSYRKVANQPLVVAMVYDMRAVLAAWQRLALVAGAGLLALLAALYVAVTQFIAQQRERESHIQGEKLEALGQLTGSIAHDFGNLLGIIGNNLEVMRRLVKGDERADKAITVAAHAVANGARLTGDLLTLARQKDLELREADLNDAIRQCMPLLEQAAGSGVEIVPDLSAQPCQCRIDATQLEVALINLVVNSTHAMKSKGKIELSTSVEPAKAFGVRRAGRIRLTVKDNGEGMSDAVRKRALEPFFTTKGSRGTGLGLAQVYAQVQKLGGDLTIDSAPGAGTSVHMMFPAIRVAPPAAAGAAGAGLGPVPYPPSALLRDEARAK